MSIFSQKPMLIHLLEFLYWDVASITMIPLQFILLVIVNEFVVCDLHIHTLNFVYKSINNNNNNNSFEIANLVM